MPNWVMVIIRASSLFFLTLIIIRLIGKSSLSKTTPYKFVSYIVIAIIAGLISLGLVKNIVFGLVTLGVWVILLLALDYLSLRSKWIHDFINGKETILIKDGKIMERNLKDVRLTGEELLRELRSKAVFKLGDVEFAIMETTGDLNVLLKSDLKPITPKDMERKVAPESETQAVILDGNILDEPLSNRGLNRDWLKVQLAKLGVSLDNVFIGQVDSSGDLFIDLFDDSIKVTETKAKEMLYANIQKVHADFLFYEFETDDLVAKKMYANNAKKLEKIMNRLKPYLLQ
jgi:uncharacterized membrane protein YcaP (DUF421 family)